ncbi:MRPL22 54S ribosomal protein L22 [Candida maltosa Xu316]
MNRFSIITKSLFGRNVRSPLSIHQRLLSQTTTKFSLLGDVTENKLEKIDLKQTESESSKVDINTITRETDEKLIQFHEEEAEKKRVKVEDYIHPLKIQLFNQNVSLNGFFKNGQIMKQQDTGKYVKFTLTDKELDLLEPTIYLHSFRIKSSMKKATIVNRMVRKYNVKTAINQLHFNSKKMSTELEKLLKKGLEEARMRNLDEDQLYIDRLWVGSDGDWIKRVDIKGRGRHGVIKHKYVHLKAVLKTEQTKNRLAWEKNQKELKIKPRMYLNNEPLNFKVRPWYKW